MYGVISSVLTVKARSLWSAYKSPNKEEKQVVSSGVCGFHSIHCQPTFRSPPPDNDTFKLAVVRVVSKYTARFTQILLPTSPLYGLA